MICRLPGLDDWIQQGQIRCLCRHSANEFCCVSKAEIPLTIVRVLLRPIPIPVQRDHTGRRPAAAHFIRRCAAVHVMNSFTFCAGASATVRILAGIGLISSCASVIGRPTEWQAQRQATVSISSTGAFSSTSCVSVPKATFLATVIIWCASGIAVKPL